MFQCKLVGQIERPGEAAHWFRLSAVVGDGAYQDCRLLGVLLHVMGYAGLLGSDVQENGRFRCRHMYHHNCVRWRGRNGMRWLCRPPLQCAHERREVFLLVDSWQLIDHLLERGSNELFDPFCFVVVIVPRSS